MKLPVEDLIRDHQKHLFAAAFSIYQNTSDADDVVQDGALQQFTPPCHTSFLSITAYRSHSPSVSRI